MKIEKNKKDQMTPIERIRAIEKGLDYDRVITVPFIGNIRSVLCGVNEKEYESSVEYIVKGEILSFNRFGLDRLNIGPNTRGISDALSLQFGQQEKEKPVIDDYKKLENMEPVYASSNEAIQKFLQAAEILSEKARDIVPIEASIGGPFTIASFLRGIEILLRDCRRKPEEIHSLMRIIVDSQKNCVDVLTKYGVGIAMADPVANPALIGPRFYEKFVFPYTKELTDYIYLKTGKKVSLHMCGETYSIWKYLQQYQVNEISLDNIVDLERAAKELGEFVPIAGNVDPVEVIMKGTKEKLYAEVKDCIQKGVCSKKGFHLTSGCDIPDGTKIEKIDWFMDAARKYGKANA